MPTPKISDQELIARITRVFQDHGFEGTSLSAISEATGLEKASLYHRFPGGKEQMAEAALGHVAKCFVNTLLAPLRESGPALVRVRETARRLQAFYETGERSCLLDTLSLPGGGAALHKAIEGTYEAWIDAFIAFAKESGFSPGQARRRAEDAVIGIHGSLILARATGKTKPFVRMIRRLPALLG